MIKTFSLFWNLCFFHGKPEDIPFSRGLMLFCLGIYFALGMPFLMLTMDFQKALMLNLVSQVITLGIWFALLRKFELMSRFTQSITALYGCWTIQLSLIVPMINASSKLEPSGSLVTVTYLAFIAWSLAVTARILQYTLAIRFQWGMLIAIGMMLIDILVTDNLFQ